MKISAERIASLVKELMNSKDVDSFLSLYNQLREDEKELILITILDVYPSSIINNPVIRGSLPSLKEDLVKIKRVVKAENESILSEVGNILINGHESYFH